MSHCLAANGNAGLDNCSVKSLVWVISEICSVDREQVLGSGLIGMFLLSILLKVSDIIYNVTDWHIKNGMH